MDHRAFLMLAMSTDEAKALLGFYPADNPSDAEINSAWRQKAFEFHPDRGGDPQRMVELNVAKDVLQGKQRPTYDRRPTSDPPTSWGGGHSTPPPPKPPIEVSFDEAKAKAGVPSDVDWVFVTPSQRNGGYSSDEFFRSDWSFAAYGRTSSHHVFVGTRHQVYQQNFVGGGPKEDIWDMKVQTYPIRGDEGREPAWLYGKVVAALKSVDSPGRFNSKVIDARGWHFSRRLPTGAEVSIKHLLVETGAVGDDDPRVQGRKHVVEMEYRKTFSDRGEPGIYPIEHGSGGFKYVEHEGINVIVNGKVHTLDMEDVKKVMFSRVGGKRLIDLVFGANYYSASKKNVTRMRGGKQLIAWMAENLTSLPEQARATMRAASTQ